MSWTVINYINKTGTGFMLEKKMTKKEIKIEKKMCEDRIPKQVEHPNR